METYVELTRKDRGYEKENAWFDFCRTERIPFITIRARSMLAIVQWDYITYPPNIDKQLFSQSEELGLKAREIYERYCTASSSLNVGQGVISFWNLPISEARSAAHELFKVIDQAARLALNQGSEILENNDNS